MDFFFFLFRQQHATLPEIVPTCPFRKEPTKKTWKRPSPALTFGGYKPNLFSIAGTASWQQLKAL